MTKTRIRTRPAHIKPTRNEPTPTQSTVPSHGTHGQHKPQPTVQPSLPASTMITHSSITTSIAYQTMTAFAPPQTSKLDRAATLLLAAEITFAKTRPAHPETYHATYGKVQSQHIPHHQTPLRLSSCRTLNPVVPKISCSFSSRQLLGRADHTPQHQPSGTQQHLR